MNLRQNLERKKYPKNIHTDFKLATMSVPIPLLIYELANKIVVTCTLINYTLLIVSVEDFRIWYLLSLVIDILPIGLFKFILRVLLCLNYIKVLLAILYRYCKEKNDLTRADDSFKLHLTDNQNEIYCWQYC